MNPGYLQLLLVVAYLIIGTIAIVSVGGWALKRFGQPRNNNTLPPASDAKNQHSPSSHHLPNHRNGSE